MAKSLVALIVYFPFLLHCSHGKLPAPRESSWKVGQVVETTSGVIKGHPASIAGADVGDVSEYLGIRFGQDTAGKNRFRPAKEYKSSKTFDAAKFGPGCPALGGVGPPAVSNSQSEDCLFVNVWTRPQVGEAKKAVMLWIYGGGFSAGDSASPMYNGAVLAKNQDVVVASLNYRTNIFGFPGSPYTDQNIGLLDQRLAVEWIRDNIEEFGGDIDRITIFGQSAGASSVDYYSYAWLHEDDIVNAFIAQSGTAMMTGPFAPKDKETRAREGWFNMTQALGCGGAEKGSSTLTCAQQATYQQIQEAMPKAPGFEGVVGFFGPTYDDEVVFENVDDLARERELVHKPLLIGSNQNESFIFLQIPPAQAPGSPVDIALQNGFRCGTAAAAKARYLDKVPVWRYHYSATGNWSQIPVPGLGATHGQEIKLVFQAQPSVDGPPSALAKLVQTAWATFAKNPNSGLTKYGWPKYNPNGETLIRLGYNSAVQPDFIQASTYDAQCPPSLI